MNSIKNKIRIERIGELLEQKIIDDIIINGPNYKLSDKYYSLPETVTDEDVDKFIMNKQINKYKSFLDYLVRYSSNREKFKTYYNDSLFNNQCYQIELELYRLWIIHRIINIDEYIGPTGLTNELKDDIDVIEKTYDKILDLSQKKIDSKWYDGLVKRIVNFFK